MKKVNEISTAPQDTQKKAFFRKEKVHIISGSQKEDHTGLYPESAIIDSMETSFEILKDENIPILYRIALFHYFIGYIHPFYDGNGRLSRFISSYLLQQEFNSPIALKLSYAIFF